MTARPHLHQQDRCQKQNSRVKQTNVLKIQARQSLITLRTISAKVIIMKPRSRQNPALQEQANPFIKMKKNKIISLCMNRGTQNELACSCKVLLKLCINGNSAEIPCSWNTITSFHLKQSLKSIKFTFFSCYYVVHSVFLFHSTFIPKYYDGWY